MTPAPTSPAPAPPPAMPPETTAGGGTNPKQKRSGYARDPFDWYVEPAWAAHMLFETITFRGAVFDPCCGIGTIPEAARSMGLPVLGCDIVDRGWPGMLSPEDFLADDAWQTGPPNIVCNPPYKLAEAFARKALSIALDKVAVLVRLDFLASQRRHALFMEFNPSHVLVFSRRPSVPPGELLVKGEVRPTSGQHDYCWIVWKVDEAGDTVMRWLI